MICESLIVEVDNCTLVIMNNRPVYATFLFASHNVVHINVAAQFMISKSIIVIKRIRPFKRRRMTIYLTNIEHVC